jgi:hypothetical protein
MSSVNKLALRYTFPTNFSPGNGEGRTVHAGHEEPLQDDPVELGLSPAGQEPAPRLKFCRLASMQYIHKRKFWPIRVCAGRRERTEKKGKYLHGAIGSEYYFVTGRRNTQRWCTRRVTDRCETKPFQTEFTEYCIGCKFTSLNLLQSLSYSKFTATEIFDLFFPVN